MEAAFSEVLQGSGDLKYVVSGADSDLKALHIDAVLRVLEAWFVESQKCWPADDGNYGPFSSVPRGTALIHTGEKDGRGG